MFYSHLGTLERFYFTPNLAKIIVTSVTMKDKELLKVNKNETKKKKKENWQNM